MATNGTFRANTKAMLLGPGQHEGGRKMVLGGEESVPVPGIAQVKNVESKSFKRLDKYLGVIAMEGVFVQLPHYPRGKQRAGGTGAYRGL